MGHARHNQISELHVRVLDILAAQALRSPAEIEPEDTFETLGIDSLGQAEVIFAIEETFDVLVPFNANRPQDAGVDLRNVAGVIAGVEALVRARRG